MPPVSARASSSGLQTPRGLADFLVAPPTKLKWESTVETLQSAVAELDELERRLHRNRLLTQSRRPASGSVVEQKRRERERARERRGVNDDARQLKHDTAKVHDEDTLAAQRKATHRSDQGLQEASAQLHNLEKSMLQASTLSRLDLWSPILPVAPSRRRASRWQEGEAAQARALVAAQEARAQKSGEELWQRATDGALLTLLQTRQASCSLPASASSSSASASSSSASASSASASASSASASPPPPLLLFLLSGASSLSRILGYPSNACHRLVASASSLAPSVRPAPPWR